MPGSHTHPLDQKVTHPAHALDTPGIVYISTLSRFLKEGSEYTMFDPQLKQSLEYDP